jgi:hypothetical protein
MADEVVAGLADTIEAMRRELARGVANAPHDGVVFDLGEAKLEFEVVITKDASADGGIRFGVVSFGGKAGLTDQATHRVSLTLQPLVRGSDGSLRRGLVSDHLPSQPK